MPRTIAWTDGTTWSVDEPTFQLVMQRLSKLGDVIWGMEPIHRRLAASSAAGDKIVVDAFAPSEDDRAVFTAGLDRALEDARAAGPTALGFEDANDYMAFLEKLAELHKLFMTDITHELPRVKR